jgi:hypothetical protein
MAILTKFTLSKLCSEIEINFQIGVKNFQEKVYIDSQIYYMLNSRENKFLFVYGSILEGEKNFKDKYYKEVPEKKDEKVYVSEKGGKSNYHLFNDCPMLIKAFSDFKIPDQIKKIDAHNNNNEAVEAYRKWFAENDFVKKFEAEEIEIETIVFHMNSRFGSLLKTHGLFPIQDWNGYTRFPNTGNTVVDIKYDLNEFQKKINILKLEFDDIFHDANLRRLSKLSGYRNSPELQSIIETTFPDYNLIERWGMKKITEFLKIAAQIKINIINLLTEYLRWTYNFNKKEFDYVTLEDFGLKCCLHCKKRKQEFN